MTGRRFTGNGDILGFGYNTDTEINGIGFGDHDPRGRQTVGPCITSVIDLREQPELNQGMVIEEGSIPARSRRLLPVGLAGADTLGGNQPKSLYETISMKKRELESLVGGPYVGAIHNTQTYLIMTHDNGQGRMYLENDRLRISWPGVGDEPIFSEANQQSEEGHRASGRRVRAQSHVAFTAIEVAGHRASAGRLRHGRGRCARRGESQRPGLRRRRRHRCLSEPLCERWRGSPAPAGRESVAHHLRRGRARVRPDRAGPRLEDRLHAGVQAAAGSPPR